MYNDDDNDSAMRSRQKHPRRTQPLALRLLRAAGSSQTDANAVSAELREIDDVQFQWAMRGGLGPLLSWYLAREKSELSKARRDILHGADLSALVWHACLVDTAVELIEHCRRMQCQLVL